ncbi:MAG: thioredoxin family protein [Alphaproteobacteria bacterium]
MPQSSKKDQNSSVQLGWQAADFKLKGTDGSLYSLADVRGPKGLVIMFICNHCPYVKTALDRIMRDIRELKPLGIGAVAISSNDVDNYPEDSFENMRKLMLTRDLPFPYLWDETQAVARSYEAACTPEFYGFDASLKLAYHGRIDAGGSKTPPPGSKRELFDAMKMIAETGQGPIEQHNAIGCSIKWK